MKYGARLLQKRTILVSYGQSLKTKTADWIRTPCFVASTDDGEQQI